MLRAIKSAMMNTAEIEFFTLRYQIGRGIALVITPNSDYRPATATNSGATGTFKVEVESRFFYLPVARKIFGPSAMAFGRLLTLKSFNGTHAGNGLAVEVQAWAKRTVKALRSSGPVFVSFVE
jgi:hypothetical protein